MAGNLALFLSNLSETAILRVSFGPISEHATHWRNASTRSCSRSPALLDIAIVKFLHEIFHS